MIIEIFYAYLLGLLSLLSPCTLIIAPVMASDLRAKFKKILSFLGGIMVTFAVLGVLSALTGKLLTNFMGPYLYLFAGGITLLAGLNRLELVNCYLPSFFTGMFTGMRTKNNFLVGLIYGGVALSCIGPLIASVLAYIIAKANLFSGFLMMVVFSFGFITPFILFGFLITDRKISLGLMKHSLFFRKAGGVLLLLVSVYLLFIAFRGML